MEPTPAQHSITSVQYQYADHRSSPEDDSDLDPDYFVSDTEGSDTYSGSVSEESCDELVVSRQRTKASKVRALIAEKSRSDVTEHTHSTDDQPVTSEMQYEEPARNEERDGVTVACSYGWDKKSYCYYCTGNKLTLLCFLCCNVSSAYLAISSPILHCTSH